MIGKAVPCLASRGAEVSPAQVDCVWGGGHLVGPQLEHRQVHDGAQRFLLLTKGVFPTSANRIVSSSYLTLLVRSDASYRFRKQDLNAFSSSQGTTCTFYSSPSNSSTSPCASCSEAPQFHPKVALISSSLFFLFSLGGLSRHNVYFALV